MRRLAYILFVLTGIVVSITAIAQRDKVDSLKKILPSSKDTVRIDFLNELSRSYTEFNNDSATYYAESSYRDAFKINYFHGIAESFSNKGDIEVSKDNFQTGEKFFREAIQWFRKTPNKNRIAETYQKLGLSLYAQSLFEDALQNLDTAYDWFAKNENKIGMSQTLSILAAAYAESGYYEKAFELDRKSLDIAIQTNNDFHRRYQLLHIGGLFSTIGDYKTALDYYKKSFENWKPGEIERNFGGAQLCHFAELFTLQHQYDSAKYYYGFADTSNPRTLRYYLVSIGNFYFAQKQYEKALNNFLRCLDYHERSHDRNQLMYALICVAKTYMVMQKDTAALRYAQEGLSIARQTGAKPFIRDAYEILSSVYDLRQQTDTAYSYYKQYTAIKDSILNDQVKGKLAAYGPEQKAALLNKEKQFQQVQLQKQTILKNILIGSIIFLMLLAAIIFRNIMLKRRNEVHRRELAENELKIQKLESERTKAELQQQATELEMQALRAQMNPHFIFNSLNSINRFILQNNKTQASEYLTKFSKLVRLILQNSQASLISLESELESLELYLDLEAVRFDHRFKYKISIPKDLDVEVLKVPPLIIQPFAENAIWHGLMHKEEKGQLDIEVSQENDQLFFRIADDGIGRKAAAELKSKSATKHKSVGLKITAERIAMLQTSNGNESPVTINDLVNADGSAAGTEVIIRMPILYD